MEDSFEKSGRMESRALRESIVMDRRPVRELEKFAVKFFAENPDGVELGPGVPVFHRWIQHRRLPELMIDVSDYEHVPSGPGVILVCHEAIYGLDQAKGKLGLVYNRRAPLNGSVEDRLRQAVAAADTAAGFLEQEPEFSAKLCFDRKAWEVSVNDRALAPNTEATWNTLAPVIRGVFEPLFDPTGYSLVRAVDPRELFRVTLRAR